MKAKYFIVLLVCILIQLGIIKKKDEETKSLTKVNLKDNLIEKAISFLRNYSFSSDYEPFITYKQCNPLWRNDLMYNKTICQVGCVITSVSMALFSRGIKIDEKLVNPAILNEWLKTHEGYYQNLFFWESVSPLGLIFLNHTTNHAEMRECLQNFNCDVVLNVYSGEHYVLATGYDSIGFLAADPGSRRPKFKYDAQEIVRGSMYHI